MKSNLFEKFKDNSIKDLTKIVGGAPATTYTGGDVHTTSPQTPGQDDNGDHSNTCVENKDIVFGPAIVVYYDAGGTVRATLSNCTLVPTV